MSQQVIASASGIAWPTKWNAESFAGSSSSHFRKLFGLEKVPRLTGNPNPGSPASQK
jgi:hypothetical protein